MSTLEPLRAAIEQVTTDPYLLTVTADGEPRSEVVEVTWDGSGDRLVVTPAPNHWGASSASGHRQVSLLWPPAERGGYSLIVNGDGGLLAGGEERLVVAPITRGVLHRPAPAPGESASACGSDCHPLFVAAST
ncbi:MAG: hypothetical protein ACREQM_07770 [Candidatus Dormibacteraceae bacterium]